MKKLVLAYSGGLDTSFCSKYLSNNGYEVHAVSINTGGFSKKDIKNIESNALKLGVASYKNIDALDAFYDKIVKYLIFGNVLKNNTYPLSVSAERVIQAVEIANYAKSIGADYIAHGSTGAGNDQVRFDMIFSIIIPDVEIITPIRDKRMSRQDEISYLQRHGVDASWEKSKYSINKGLWGTSIGGEETLTSYLPLPEDAFPSQVKVKKPVKLRLTFSKGELTAIDDRENVPLKNIEILNNIASEYAIGRGMHVGDTIIGIKGRVGFEAAAPMIIIKTHHTLEKHTLSKWQLMHKDYLANWYGTLLHEGHYFDEFMRDAESFLESSQRRVSGKVDVSLFPYRFVVEGVESNHDLMTSSFGTYGEVNSKWTGDDAKGFIKILSNQGKINHWINHKE